MVQIDEEYIRAASPNPAAAVNGRGLVKDFSNLSKTADGTCWWGDCKGSGKNPYRVSADFISEEKPVFRCTCPSRQFPCKHALGLMYCISAGKQFCEAPLPEDIAQKRGKIAKPPVQRAKSDAPQKTNTAALVKKMKQQLEGLASVRRFLEDVLRLGFAAASPKQLKQWQTFAKELESCYLTGPQTEIYRLLAVLGSDSKEADRFSSALQICGRLHAVCKRGEEFLSAKLGGENPDYEASEVYELLGYNWKLDQLKALDLVQREAQLVQLAFVCLEDEAAGESVDVGFWAELAGGTLEQTKNYVPRKAAKYVKHEDSDFAKRLVPEMFRYPGGRRVRWEAGMQADVTAEDLAKICAMASSSVAESVKAAKNALKSPLSEGYFPALLRYSRLVKADGFALEGTDGALLSLRDSAALGTAVPMLEELKNLYLSNQVAFGVFHMCGERLAFMPLSLVTDREILRLQY